MNAAAGQRGPSLSAALHLVRAYQLVAQCSDEAPTSACRRARQLQETFESTTPLLLRQRVEDIWAADCRNVSQGTVLAWVQDFPAPQAATSSGDFSEVARAVQAKLFTCFLGDPDGDSEPSFHAWLDKILPSPKALDSHSLPRVDDIRAGTRDDTPLDLCGRAVRACSAPRPRPRCAALPSDVTALHRAVGRESARPATTRAVPLHVCARYAEMLWLGQDLEVPGSFARPPDDRHDPDASTSADRRRAFAALRTACDDRHGKPDSFPADLAALTAHCPRLRRVARGRALASGPPHRSAARGRAVRRGRDLRRVADARGVARYLRAARSASRTLAASGARRCRGAPSTIAS